MKRTAILILILLIVSAAAVSASANGLFVQSPLYPTGIDYSYASQLGLAPELSAANLTSVPADSVLQAIGNSAYPVTPGDRFALSYSDGKSLITLELQADTDCKVTIPSVAVVDAAGMTYRDFKLHVENLISTSYTYSSPQLSITSCGVFSVRISGSVSYARYVTAWGLSRLSDLAVYADDLASTRNVTVTTPDGNSVSYDLYKAMREDSSQDNPLLVPGSEIVFNRATATVGIGGAVKRPGAYQPLAGESLYDMIDRYCNGLLNSADRQSITVSNYAGGSYSAKTMDIEAAKAYIPADGDTVTVAFSAQSMPYVTVTGAIATPADSSTVSAAGKILYQFIPGETAQQLIRNIADLLIGTSDTNSVYILRDGARIMVDVSDALTSPDKGDVVLQQGDTVVIPFSQFTVTVTGSVNSPGSYAYMPDRGAEYYINLAKGYSADSARSFKIVDRDGKKINTDVVPADSTIIVNRNNLTANLAIVASVLSIVSAVLTIIINGHTIATF